MTPVPGHLAGGVWGVVATPFCGPKAELDEPSLARLVEHYGKLAVAGLTALGVFGEAARQSLAERRIVLGIIARTSDLPVVVGCAGFATQPVIDEAMAARDALGEQLAAIMIQVNTPSADALAAHLRSVHDATGCRIVVQDYPAATGVRTEPGELAAAVAGTPAVAAIKAESPPTPAVIAALTAAVEVPVFGGLGGISLLDELACGAAGAMTGFSYPEALIACVDAFRDNGLAAARSVFAPWLPLVNFEQHAGPALAVRKQCLLRRGLIAESVVRPPAPRMPPGLDALLGQHLDAADALLDGALLDGGS